MLLLRRLPTPVKRVVSNSTVGRIRVRTKTINTILLLLFFRQSNVIIIINRNGVGLIRRVTCTMRPSAAFDIPRTIRYKNYNYFEAFGKLARRFILDASQMPADCYG